MTGLPPRARLVELDALRGIGALCVLVFHYSTRFHELFPQAAHVPFSFPGGNYRVLLFFTISGFAIFFTLDRIRSVADFMVNRVARLYPAYLVAMLLTLSIEYLAKATQLLVGPGAIVANITMKVEDNVVKFERPNEEGKTRAFHGLMRALVANNVKGVSEGFKRELDIVGVGDRAEVKGREVVFQLGYSHPVRFPIPEGIDITVDAKTGHITVTGIDRQKVGQVSAEIRSLREPDPYKGKGIKYSDEVIRRKAGKAAGK